MAFQHVWSVLEAGIRDGAFPGAVAAVADEERVLASRHFGHASLESPCVTMRIDMIFDVASLTKVVAATPAVLRLVETGALSLDEPVAKYIDTWRGPDKEQVTIRQLLTHTGGLAAWYPTYARPRDGETNECTAIDVISNLPLAHAPGTAVEYSCLGFILLGHIVESVANLSLDRFCMEHIFRPLRMWDTGYRAIDHGAQGDKPNDENERLVATEHDNAYEREAVQTLGLTFSGWRDGIAVGEVHDGNARYAMGGVSGNAGLFSTAHDLVRYGQSWLRALRGDAAWLSRAMATLAVTNHTPGLDSARGLGWLLVPHDGPAKAAGPTPGGPRPYGELLSAGSFGHTGFTGTSLWIDPVRGLVFVLLTNRVHPYVRTGIDLVRARFHNAAVAAVARTDWPTRPQRVRYMPR